MPIDWYSHIDRLNEMYVRNKDNFDTSLKKLKESIDYLHFHEI
jgi:hypothetical protein